MIFLHSFEIAKVANYGVYTNYNNMFIGGINMEYGKVYGYFNTRPIVVLPPNIQVQQNNDKLWDISYE